MLRCRFVHGGAAWREAAAHAERAGDRRDELESLAWVPLMIWAGPTDAEAASLAVASSSSGRGRQEGDVERLDRERRLRGGLGRFDEARELFGRARALLQEAELDRLAPGRSPSSPVGSSCSRATRRRPSGSFVPATTS